MRRVFFSSTLLVALFLPSEARPSDERTRDGEAELLQNQDAGAKAAPDLVQSAVHGSALDKKKAEADLVRLGELAVPALIVGAKKSAGDENRKWCEDVLDEMGKRTAADQVQTKSDDALLAVFQAFVELKDVDSLSAIFPFVGAQRSAVRNGARDAIRAYGDAALPELRAHYINLGNTLPHMVTTEELRDAYFNAIDELRSRDTLALFDAGLALAATDLPASIADLDSALARDPMLDRRHEAAPIYMRYALTLGATDRAKAREYDLKVIRIADAAAPEGNQARSELAFFDAEDLRARDIVDRNAYARAATLDPSNENATKAVAQIDADRALAESKTHKTMAAIVAFFAMTAALVVGFFAYRKRRAAE